MKNPPTLKVGDLVRFVIEDEVTSLMQNGAAWTANNSFQVSEDHIVSIEVVKKPVAVGDTITSAELVAGEWGRGTVVKDLDYNDAGGGVWLKGSRGWTSSMSNGSPEQTSYFEDHSEDGYKVIYLP